MHSRISDEEATMASQVCVSVSVLARINLPHGYLKLNLWRRALALLGLGVQESLPPHYFYLKHIEDRKHS